MQSFLKMGGQTSEQEKRIEDFSLEVAIQEVLNG